MSELFGTEALFEAHDFFKLMIRLGLDLGFASIVIVLVYHRLYRNREFVFTYYVVNIITFSMCVLLRKVPTELGFALGLFAVFGILRYRTEPIRMRDLTYMFIVIGLAILNAVANHKISFVELVTVNALIAGVAVVVELQPGGRRRGSTPMLYDTLELLQPGRGAELIADLVRRTGLDIERVQLHRVDLLRDAAEITVFYRGERPS
jgi:hypothetical protein